MKQKRMNDVRCDDQRPPQVAIFLTDMGWFGLWGGHQIVCGLTIGHASPQNVRDLVFSRIDTDESARTIEEVDWFPELRIRMQQFAAGFVTGFADVEIQLPNMTAFQERVVRATRRIPYGQTISYGQLAAKAGSPRAARAVGNVMASNRIPVIIPCHRVIASGGRPGGFSAPLGTDLKQRMLAIESVNGFAD